MLRKYLMAAGLSAAALGMTLPSAASAQNYGLDRGPRSSLSVSIGGGYSPGYYDQGYYGQSYYDRGYGYYGNGYRYDRRDWRDDRRHHRHEHHDHDRDDSDYYRR